MRSVRTTAFRGSTSGTQHSYYASRKAWTVKLISSNLRTLHHKFMSFQCVRTYLVVFEFADKIIVDKQVPVT